MSHILGCFPKAEFIIFEVQLSKNLCVFKCNQHKSAEVTTINIFCRISVGLVEGKKKKENLLRTFLICVVEEKTFPSGCLLVKSLN